MNADPALRRLRPYLSALVILAVLAVGFWVQGRSPASSDAGSADRSSGGVVESGPPASDGADSDESEEAEADGERQAVSGLPVVREADLPPEARDTLADISRGGPYEFERDDTVFGNREGLLPGAASGYYREYTVVTPGIGHRGARRIVVGANGERYYTDDHYASFREILP